MDAFVDFDISLCHNQIRVELPVSKSIVNRLAIIYALNGRLSELGEVAKSCEDVELIVKALSDDSSDVVNVGDSGTAMRFLLSYFSYKGERKTLTGSERLCQRPVLQLAEALDALGAKLVFTKDYGYPPVVIDRGIDRIGGTVDFRGGYESSQFVSSLMLIAPMLDNGLVIILPADGLSLPYIEMTLKLIRECEVDARFENGRIVVPHSQYRLANDYELEADWSAAAFWYEFASLCKGVRINLPNLKRVSVQGDSILPGLFEQAGVKTIWKDDGCEIINCGMAANEIRMSLKDAPDLVIPFVVSCMLNGIKFELDGIGHLKLKESDRIAAIISESAALGYVVNWDNDRNILSWRGGTSPRSAVPVIDSHKDHRVAMAFALAAARIGKIKVNGIDCVRKSYPGFIDEMQKTGFTLDECFITG